MALKRQIGFEEQQNDSLPRRAAERGGGEAQERAQRHEGEARRAAAQAGRARAAPRWPRPEPGPRRHQERRHPRPDQGDLPLRGEDPPRGGPGAGRAELAASSLDSQFEALEDLGDDAEVRPGWPICRSSPARCNDGGSLRPSRRPPPSHDETVTSLLRCGDAPVSRRKGRSMAAEIIALGGGRQATYEVVGPRPARRSGSRGVRRSTPPWVVVTAKCSPTASAATSSTHPAPAVPRRSRTIRRYGLERNGRVLRRRAQDARRSAPPPCSATPGAARSVWRMPRCTRRGRGGASPSTRGQAPARSTRGRRRRRNGRPALLATPISPGGLPRRVRLKPACLPDLMDADDPEAAWNPAWPCVLRTSGEAPGPAGHARLSRSIPLGREPQLYGDEAATPTTCSDCLPRIAAPTLVDGRRAAPTSSAAPHRPARSPLACYRVQPGGSAGLRSHPGVREAAGVPRAGPRVVRHRHD